MEKLKWVVSKAIADHYEVINTHSPILESKIGTVDFRKISLAQADEIYAKGTLYLKKKVKRTTKKKAVE